MKNKIIKTMFLIYIILLTYGFGAIILKESHNWIKIIAFVLLLLVYILFFLEMLDIFKN